MKKIFLLLLLFSLAAAESGVSSEMVTVIDVEAETANGKEYITCEVNNESPRSIYNVVITLDKTKLGELVEIIDENPKRVVRIATSSVKTLDVRWRISTNLTHEEINDIIGPNDIRVIWDNTTEINSIVVDTKELTEGDEIKTETGTIKIRVNTEANSFYEGLTDAEKVESGLKNGMTKVTVERVDSNGNEIEQLNEITRASPEGIYEEDIQLTEKDFGKHYIRVTVEDLEGKTGNKASETFVVDYQQTFLNTMDRYSWIFVLLIIALIALAVPLSGVILMHRRGKKKEEKEKSYEKMVQKKKELKKDIERLKAKEFAGLTDSEQKRREVHELQLAEIEEHLLNDERHLKNLRERARRAVEQAKKGVPSKDIRSQLIKEEYSEKEIEKIKEFFAQIKKG